MKVYNVIMAYHPDGQQVLFCRRAKPPFEGQYNFVGGKVEPGNHPSRRPIASCARRPASARRTSA